MSVSKTITETVSNSKTASALQQPSATTASVPLQRPYGKIVLTLENCLLPEAKLEQTPSQNDGLDRETETDLRVLGCELIQTAGILLKLPQVAMATGQVLFQRFFYSKSFVRHSMEATAMSCICLASKIEEAPRRIRDVINVFHHIKQVRSQKPMIPMILDQHYINLKSQVIKAERRVLKELGFCVHVKHPHKLIVMYLKYLELEKHQNMMQMAWNFMNDSFRTDVFVRYHPETIACACIYLTARKHNIPLPNSPPWFVIFRVSEDDMLDVCYRIMALYKRGKPNAEQLEAAVETLKKKYQEQRKKDRPEANATPPAVIMVDRNNGSHNAWGGFIQRALPPPVNPTGTTNAMSNSNTNSSSSGNNNNNNNAAAGGVGKDTIGHNNNNNNNNNNNSNSNHNNSNSGINSNEFDSSTKAEGKRSTRSRSNSLSKSRSKSRSPRSLSRSRSHSRSHSRSRSRTSRSRTKTRSRSAASRSRSRSRSPHSPHYATEKAGGGGGGGTKRISKKSRHRSRTPSKSSSSSAKKKSSRHHYSSRTPSPMDSPQKYKKSEKRYDRRSGRDDRTASDGSRYMNGSDRDRDRGGERTKGVGGSGTMLDRDRQRDHRDRDRDRVRSDGKGGGGYERDDYRRSDKDTHHRGSTGKHDKYSSSSSARHSDGSSRHRSSKHEQQHQQQQQRDRSRDRDRDRDRDRRR